jgi:hypothetical protein
MAFDCVEVRNGWLVMVYGAEGFATAVCRARSQSEAESLVAKLEGIR